MDASLSCCEVDMEFDVIERYFKPLSLITRPGDVSIGDDGALITPAPNSQLVVVTDTLVSGVHFVADAEPYDIAWKALAVNLSDLAAMGATPAFYSLALTLPNIDQAWLSAFSRGLADCAAPYALPLIGGDTTKGPLCITVTAQGWVSKGCALLRAGAKVDDDIYVSGTIGEAGLGLSLALSKQAPTNRAQQAAFDRFNRPIARVALGQALAGLAHSAIDVSDGLLADLTHILTASAVGAHLDLSTIPITQAVREWACGAPLKPLQAGDDYELCFTAPKKNRDKIQALAEALDLPLSRIGEVTAQPGLVVDNETPVPERLGYQHF